MTRVTVIKLPKNNRLLDRYRVYYLPPLSELIRGRSLTVVDFLPQSTDNGMNYN